MKKKWLLAAGFLILGVASGCQSDKLGKPNLANPGNATTQQKRALRYDPYPSTDVGGNMAGTRPRAYEVPPAEPTQARWNRSTENTQRWGTDGNE